MAHNYVLWGGREGYETLLNTDMKRELDQLGRFLNLVVEHKHDIGFPGAILIEPKPFEPTKHQYDYDVATVYAFLQRYGLEHEIKVNIEVNHATLAGHDFAHEVAVAVNSEIFGSIDANAGDDRLGWDLDRFPVSVDVMTLGMVEILRGGGFTTGGLNFDAKLRRQSIARDDLFIAHIGGMDTMARALLAAASIIESGELDTSAVSAGAVLVEAETISTVGPQGAVVPLRVTVELPAIRRQSAPALGWPAAAARDAFELLWDVHVEPQDTAWAPVDAAHLVP